MGQCPGCREWNTFVEETVVTGTGKGSGRKTGNPHTAAEPETLSDISLSEEERTSCGIRELDRVLGGGIVEGSLILVGGDPGIGKSTLLLKVCQRLAAAGKEVLYVSGEESLRQIKLRASRLGVDTPHLHLSSTTNIEAVVESIQRTKPDIVMVDSIQTMNLSALNSSSGSVTQVRECTQILINLAKTMDIPIFIVGHVNKDGAIAGPKVMEHMVDAVLYFEGERNLSYRILRAIKNRYGSTNEIGVFEMGENGLDEVANPSKAMLEGRPENVSGTCVACVIEGSRPILAEVQALASKSGYAVPKRMSTGFDYNRLTLLLAVLEKRCGYFFGTLDAYINVVGGMRLDEPAADLPIALALVSNLTDRVIPDDLVAFGEIGLAGELRAVNRVLVRVKEAQRLGFRRCILPKQCVDAITADVDIQLIGVTSLAQAINQLG